MYKNYQKIFDGIRASGFSVPMTDMDKIKLPFGVRFPYILFRECSQGINIISSIHNGVHLGLINKNGLQLYIIGKNWFSWTEAIYLHEQVLRAFRILRDETIYGGNKEEIVRKKLLARQLRKELSTNQIKTKRTKL